MQLSNNIRVRNQLPPTRSRNLKLELNMSQVDEDNNESNVTARNYTQEETRKDSSYLKPRSRTHGSEAPNLSFNDKSYSKILTDQEEKIEEKKPEEEVEQDSSASVRSSDISSSEDEQMELKRQSLLNSKQAILMHKQSILLRQSSICRLNGITIIIPIQWKQMISNSFFEEEFIISRRFIIKPSAIVYLFQKKLQGHTIFMIDPEYEPANEDNTRTRNQASFQQPQQSKKGLFSPLTSPRCGVPNQTATKLEITASILMTFTRNEKISRRLSRINLKQQKKQKRNSSSDSDEDHKKEQDKKKECEGNSEINEKKEQKKEQQPAESEPHQFLFKTKLQNILKHQQQQRQLLEEKLAMEQLKQPRYKKVLQKLKATSLFIQDLALVKYNESVQKLYNYLEDSEDEQEEAIIESEGEGEETPKVTKKLLSEKSRDKLKMYFQVLSGFFGFLIIIFIISYIKASWKVYPVIKKDEELDSTEDL